MHSRPASESLDDDNPEWSVEAIARARPAREVLPTLFGNGQAEAMQAGPDEATPDVLRAKVPAGHG